jgi:LemA protein
MIYIILGIVVLLIIVGIAIYNGLVALRQQVDNAWAQIDVQLKRRYDLIPNLVETVKGYMNFEQETLQKVIEARSAAMSARGPAAKGAAEGALTQALGGIFAIAESYPELKSNTNMLQLQEELSTTENKIAYSRQFYNDSVMQYNTKTEQFPASIFANMFGFKRKELFEVVDPVQREAVKVDFSTS